jgi:peptide deformylase
MIGNLQSAIAIGSFVQLIAGFFEHPFNQLTGLGVIVNDQNFFHISPIIPDIMAVKPILRMGDPLLLRMAQPVQQFDTDELHLLISDMLDTMAAANGAGLAAPQIGVDLQIVIFGSGQANPRYPDAPLIPQTVLCNPVITPLGDEEEVDWEGCLSVPGLRAKVPRHAKVRYGGFDQFGEPIDRTAEGFHARVVQHECDHLIGKLYPMRVRDFSQFGFIDALFPGIVLPEDD